MIIYYLICTTTNINSVNGSIMDWFKKYVIEFVNNRANKWSKFCRIYTIDQRLWDQPSTPISITISFLVSFTSIASLLPCLTVCWPSQNLFHSFRFIFAFHTWMKIVLSSFRIAIINELCNIPVLIGHVSELAPWPARTGAMNMYNHCPNPYLQASWPWLVEAPRTVRTGSSAGLLVACARL